VEQVSATLKKVVRATRDTFLAIEVSDGKRMLTMIRGKVIIERY
jgi:hypothetical protein